MPDIVRSPLYAGPLAVLLGVIVASALARGASGAAGTSPTPAAVATATPVPQPTPTPAQADVLLDARRALDLAKVRDALDAYRRRFGAYPTTESYVATLCAQAFDAGCLLTRVTKDLPASDGTYPYWYRSDGATYTLFARVESPPEDDACPADVPPQLAGHPVLCLTSDGGGR